jgi:hypothetical protein
VGWTEYGDWRRAVKGLDFEWDGEGKNCGDYCSFPSECRWSKKLKAEEKSAMTGAEEEKVESRPSQENSDVEMTDANADAPFPTEKRDLSLPSRPEEAITTSTSSMLQKVVKSAEKRSAGLKKALLSPSSASGVDVVTPKAVKGERTQAGTANSISLQRGLAKMAVICRIPETLYE